MRIKITLLHVLMCLPAFFYSHHASSQAILALFFGDKITSDKVSVGLYFAGQANSITGTDNSKKLWGLAIGAYTDVKLSEKWALTNFMSFKSPKGMKKVPVTYGLNEDGLYSGDAEITRKLVYFEIVPLFRYNFTPSISLAAGPQVGIRLSSKDFYIDEREDGSTETVEYKIKDYMTRFDAGLAADVQYVLHKGKGVRFNIRFCSGFVNIYKDNVPFSGNNQYLHFGVGVPIVGSKKK